MKKTFWHQIALVAISICTISSVSAIPAPKKAIKLLQPDGSYVFGRMVGDEFFHYALSEDNYVLLPDKIGFYSYAVKDSTGELEPGNFIAKNLQSRTENERLFLNSISPAMPFSRNQLEIGIENRIKRSITKKSNSIPVNLRSIDNTDEIKTQNTFPTNGKVKSLVLLVNFSDVSFRETDAGTIFSDMLNKKGYNNGKFIGSASDYFSMNSNGKFSSEFDVVGPVTLDNPMSYYGENDDNQEDKHPARMVYDACLKVASNVDFSKFDEDSDGYVDNIYVFYAGIGENDGGSANSIWPHAWALQGEGLTLKLNGKNIDNYACSAELQGDSSITGIGPFAHEFSHILGLLDEYDSDYSTNGSSFDLGEWSLMAYGAYNCDEAVPPSFSVIDRQMLGWITPIELGDNPLSIVLPPLDSSNIGYKISTSNPEEYYLLENRQQRKGSWDEYLYSHGLLIYHIDQRSDATISVIYNSNSHNWPISNLWEYNILNAISNHQCIDIEEADDIRTIYNGDNLASYISGVKGDPFPGSYNKKSFTDSSTPSMITWSGTSLDKPISNISEINDTISFDYKGGSNFGNSGPEIKPATAISPFKFTANWDILYGATGYFFDLFKIEKDSYGNSNLNYVDGYENLYLTDNSLTINELEDQTTYQYRVRATNGSVTTGNSDIAEVTTPDANNIIVYVKDRTIFLKGIDHNSKVRIYNLARLVKETSETDIIRVKDPGIYFAEAYLNGVRVVTKILVK
jgi:M6 family metalloprotease-like protein